MNILTRQLSNLDIKVRNYLNIKNFCKNNRTIYNEQYLIEKQIPYFWLNASTLVTGYIIKTIDGYIKKPVIGVRQLRRMYLLHLNLIDSQQRYMERFQHKCFINALYSLNTSSSLPSEIIRYILQFLK